MHPIILQKKVYLYKHILNKANICICNSLIYGWLHKTALKHINEPKQCQDASIGPRIVLQHFWYVLFFDIWVVTFFMSFYFLNCITITCLIIDYPNFYCINVICTSLSWKKPAQSSVMRITILHHIIMTVLWKLLGNTSHSCNIYM